MTWLLLLNRFGSFKIIYSYLKNFFPRTIVTLYIECGDELLQGQTIRKVWILLGETETIRFGVRCVLAPGSVLTAR